MKKKTVKKKTTKKKTVKRKAKYYVVSVFHNGDASVYQFEKEENAKEFSEEIKGMCPLIQTCTAISKEHIYGCIDE